MKIGDKVRITDKGEANKTIDSLIPFIPLDYRGSEGVITKN